MFRKQCNIELIDLQRRFGLSGADATLPPLSRNAVPGCSYFLQFRVCRRGVSATPPLKGPVAPHPVWHLSWLLGGWGCSTASCEGCRNVDLRSCSRGWRRYTLTLSFLAQGPSDQKRRLHVDQLLTTRYSVFDGIYPCTRE